MCDWNILGTHMEASFPLSRNGVRHLYVVDTGRKWADLVKRSMVTHIELYPREMRGKPTMKSIHMFSHFLSGMLNGCRFPAGLR
jgi:hypothetical protein